MMKRLEYRKRAFAREVGVIVLGVLLALAFGEIADTVRWRFKAARTNTAIDLELARAAGVLDERVLVQPCLDRRIAELDRLIRTARRTGRLPEIREIGGPPVRPLQTAAWDDAVGSGALPHLKPERRSMLSLNYPLLRAYPQQLEQEWAHWATLHAIERTPGPVSDDLIAEMAVTVSRLRVWSYGIGLNARQIKDDIGRQGIRPSYHLILDREGTRAEVAAFLRPGCRPLAASG